MKDSNGALSLGQRFRRAAPALLGLMPAIMIPALEWIPGISTPVRRTAILVALALAVIGLVSIAQGERRLDALERQNAQLRQRINGADPEYFLSQVSGALFREGAWRLTVFRKAHSPELHLKEHLVRVAGVASDGTQASLGPSLISIKPRTHFSELFSANLADPRYHRVEQSGTPPEDVQSHAWNDWRDEIFGGSAIIDDGSTLRARKIAWFAAQDAKTQAVIAVIAESTEAEGVSTDLLAHKLTPPWLFFVAQLAELRHGDE
jgi:hypothetical protein